MVPPGRPCWPALLTRFEIICSGRSRRPRWDDRTRRPIDYGCAPAIVTVTVPALLRGWPRPPEALKVVELVPRGAVAATVRNSETWLPVVLVGVKVAVTPAIGAPRRKLTGPTKPALRSIVIGRLTLAP